MQINIFFYLSKGTEEFLIKLMVKVQLQSFE